LGLCDFQVLRPARVRSLKRGSRRNFDGWKASSSPAGGNPFDTQRLSDGAACLPIARRSEGNLCRQLGRQEWAGCRLRRGVPVNKDDGTYRRATRTTATILLAPSVVARGRCKALNVPAKIAKSRRVGRSGTRQEGRGNFRRGCPRASRVAFDRDHPVSRWIPRQNRTGQAHQIG
jgi:hypothetical protein